MSGNTNDREIQQTLELLGGMYRALAALRTEVYPVNPELYAVMAEGPLEQIRRLQSDLEELSGAAALIRPQAQVETHEGDLREIDLDSLTFTLRTPDGFWQIPCTFSEDLAELAKEALDRRVLVTGSRVTDPSRRGHPLQVTRLQIVEGSKQENTDPREAEGAAGG